MRSFVRLATQNRPLEQSPTSKPSLTIFEDGAAGHVEVIDLFIYISMALRHTQGTIHSLFLT